jgi:hypothetical protein
MSMSASDRAKLFSSWIQPSSRNEKDQQDRAERMVRDAIESSSAFDGTNFFFYTKGSYPNNTNVRQDSDVDVVVEVRECCYSDYKPGVSPAVPDVSSPYTGPWRMPADWRKAVNEALVAHFGASGVDSSGEVAINISAVEGSRPSADVVPSYRYYRYDNTECTQKEIGSCVWPRSGGTKIVNWPHHQLEKGRKKNDDTGGRYKDYVRALKRVENILADDGVIDELPSYFMECLVFNVPNSILASGGSLDDDFRATLVELWRQLGDEHTERKMVEPNYMKWLFTKDKKWTLQDGKDLIQAAWTYLDYAS